MGYNTPVSESGGKSKGEVPRRKPLPSDPWLNEGGTARYAEGKTHRGHDVNALLDRIDRDDAEGERELAEWVVAGAGLQDIEGYKERVAARQAALEKAAAEKADAEERAEPEESEAD